MPNSAASPKVRVASPSARHYHGLDLIRGLAAITVLIYHVDFMFGVRDRLLPGGYLAVDLFFILSGFVIACNYETSIQERRITLTQFMVRRVARLYPLYLLTLLVGLFVMTARSVSQFNHFDTGRLSVAAVVNLFVLPSFAHSYGSDTLFPFNAASWSIFYELVINVVFVVALTRLKGKALLAVWILSGSGLAVTAMQFGNIDVGWGTPNFLAAFPRVAFSFITGMLIWRRYVASPWIASGRSFVALLLAYAALIQARLWIPVSLHGAVDMLAVVTLLPALVMAGVSTPFSRCQAATAVFLGEISYAVYLAQGSLIIAAAGFTQAVFHQKIYDLSPMAGLIFVPFCIAVGYFCFRWFEMPARRAIRAFGDRRREPIGPNASHQGQ